MRSRSLSTLALGALWIAAQEPHAAEEPQLFVPGERVEEDVFQVLERAIDAVEARVAAGFEDADTGAAQAATLRAARLQRAAARLEVLSRELRAPLTAERRAAWVRERTRAANAHALAQPWIEAASQSQDPDLREDAFAGLRGALLGNDREQALAALTTLASLGEVDFDRASFRASVLPFTTGHDDVVRVKALYALWNTAPEEGDLDLVLDLATSGSDYARSSLTHLIALFAKGAVEGPAADVVLGLLDDPDPRHGVEVLRGLWGTRVGPGLEGRLIELARGSQPELRRAALHFALATLQHKSAAVIEELLRTLLEDDPELVRRALWGLGHGVSQEHGRAIADALVQLYRAHDSPRSREECARLILRYGDASHAAQLE